MDYTSLETLKHSYGVPICYYNIIPLTNNLKMK